MISLGSPDYFFSLRGYLDRAWETVTYAFFIPEEQRLDRQSITPKLEATRQFLTSEIIKEIIDDCDSIKYTNNLNFEKEKQSIRTLHVRKVIFDTIRSIHIKYGKNRSGIKSADDLITLYIRLGKLVIDQLCEYCDNSEYSLSSDILDKSDIFTALKTSQHDS